MRTTQASDYPGPQLTPTPIKQLIATTCILSLLTSFLTPFFQYFNFSTPFDWLALSWWGLEHFFIWQPLTHLLIADSSAGVTLSLLLTLAFQMYILWTFGSDLVYRYSQNSFLLFYFGCGLLTGLATLLIMPLTGQYMPLATPAASIIAIAIAWTLSNPTAQLFLFFLIPIRANWLIALFLGTALLINLSGWHLTHFCFYLLAPTISYLWGLISWGLESPFDLTKEFEVKVENWIAKLKNPFDSKKSKIYDIKTRQLTDDDQFMDQMLAKISKFGEGSLTPQEKERMRNISRQK